VGATGNERRCGVLLPHFGPDANGPLVIEAARRAEAYGFDSVWVRDHILYAPNPTVDPPDRAFLESLTTLTAVGVATERIALGTGALVPIRHPLTTAHVCATMTHYVGPGRLILGLGSGSSDLEFESVDLPSTRLGRVKWMPEFITVLKRLWTEASVDIEGEFYRLAGLSLEPHPAGAGIPLWYCSTTPASVRVALRQCDGWMPGRIPLATFRERLSYMGELAAAEGHALPTVANRPLVVLHEQPGQQVPPALLRNLCEYANRSRLWLRPEHGEFRSRADLRGMLVAGDPGEVTEQLREIFAAGCDHLVLDLRAEPGTYLRQLEILAEGVLSHLKDAGDTPNDQRIQLDTIT
jgi:alkanesulfonate monooxygenase SsuD/methylene tetrahydromethanopterin reductase-like flavin-dependent oxidoreductase (luciferase family)